MNIAGGLLKPCLKTRGHPDPRQGQRPASASAQNALCARGGLAARQDDGNRLSRLDGQNREMAFHGAVLSSRETATPLPNRVADGARLEDRTENRRTFRPPRTDRRRIADVRAHDAGQQKRARGVAWARMRLSFPGLPNPAAGLTAASRVCCVAPGASRVARGLAGCAGAPLSQGPAPDKGQRAIIRARRTACRGAIRLPWRARGR